MRSYTPFFNTTATRMIDMEYDDAAVVIGAGPYGLAFAGALAGYTFGPLCRFVVGSKVTARQVAGHAARATNSSIPYPLPEIL